MIAGYERLLLNDLRSALKVDQRSLERHIREAGMSPKHLVWRDVRGMWDLPETFAEYSQLLEAKEGAADGGKRKRRGGRGRRRRKQEAQTKLRNRLIEAFPQVAQRLPRPAAAILACRRAE